MEQKDLFRNRTLQWVSRQSDQSYFYLPHLPLAGKVDHRVADELERTPLPTTREGWERRFSPVAKDVESLLDAMIESEVLVDDKVDAALQRVFDQHRPLTNITLMLTSDCNLRCRYCYADGGRKAEVMPRSLIDHALTYFWRERFSGGNAASLSFHGGGEPTMMFKEMGYSMERFSEEAARRNVTPHFSVATNGLFCEAARAVLAKYRVGMTLSWDGPPDIQHGQRPSDSGKPYVRRMVDNLNWALAEGLEVNVRSTITSKTLPRMKEIVTYFADLGLKSVNLEPCAVDGRAKSTMAPNLADFADACADLRLAYLSKGFTVSSTFLAWGKFSPRFCGMTSTNCMVTVNGNLSSCYEVLSVYSALERPFFFGRIHPTTGMVTIDQHRRSYIGCRSSSSIKECASCAYQLSCAGWCPYKVSRSGFDYRSGIDPDVCAAIRAGTTKLIHGLADGEWQTMKTMLVTEESKESPKISLAVG